MYLYIHDYWYNYIFTHIYGQTAQSYCLNQCWLQIIGLFQCNTQKTQDNLAKIFIKDYLLNILMHLPGVLTLQNLTKSRFWLQFWYVCQRLCDTLWHHRSGTKWVQVMTFVWCQRITKALQISPANIRVRSHEHHNMLNHWQLDYMCNSLFHLETKKTFQLCTTGHIWGESADICNQSILLN